MCKAECEFSIKITPYIDGELSDEEASAVSEHLNSCEECSGLYKRLRRVVDIASDLPHLKPENSAYIQNLRGRIRKPAVRWLPDSLSLFARQVAFAGVSLLVLAGVYWGVETPRTAGSIGAVVADASNKDSQPGGTTQPQHTGQPQDTVQSVAAPVHGNPTLVAMTKKDASQETGAESGVSDENLHVNQPKVLIDGSDEVIASMVMDSAASSSGEEPGNEESTGIESQNSSVFDARTSPKTTSGIDWDAVDLKSALVNSQSSASGSSSMVYPPVYSSYEQVAGLYGNLASDYSSSDVQFDDSTVNSGGIVILKVHNQTEFWPSLYKHLLGDEDYRVRYIAYNQYEESKIVVDYRGSDSFEAGFASFASRVQSLSSVVGLLIIETGEPDSSVLTLTIRPSEKSSSH